MRQLVATSESRFRAGFTLVELAVCLAIIGLLVALISPAIMASRSAARKIDCSNRLKQIGMAANAFASQNGRFPGMLPPGKEATLPFATGPQFSPFVWLLPFLDLQVAYGKLRLNDNPGLLAYSPASSSTNSELLRLPIAVFQCPADRSRQGSINFRVSGGTSPGIHATPEIPAPAGAKWGLVAFGGWPPSRIRDGLSQTIAFSERSIGDDDPSVVSPTQDVQLLGYGTFLTADDAESECRNAAIGAWHDSVSGSSWLPAGYHVTWYNHITTPNSAIVDCTSATTLWSAGPAVINARSWHPGGVNAASCDGAVRFVSREIARSVWRAVGTIDGRESATLE